MSKNKMFMANSFDPNNTANLPETEQKLIERRQKYLGSPYRLFYEQPVHFVRGEGVFLYDADGNDYLDAYNNVPVVGHSNPHVAQKVSEQLTTLNTHTRYLTDNILAYTERMVPLFGGSVDQAIYVCTGSEAVDLSLRVARHFTGRRGVIATKHAYHGTTESVAEISPSLGPNNVIPDFVELVEAPDLANESVAESAQMFAERVEKAIANLIDRGFPPAAIIIDSVMSSDGLQGTEDALIAPAVKKAQQAGALYIADEVQSGFGRTGIWWGFTRQQTDPDLVVIGKPMGNGIPIAALFGKSHILDAFGKDVRYFNTFGGNPVSIAAASAVVDEIEAGGLVERAAKTGGMLLDDFLSLAKDDARLSAVRGAGLFLAIELSDEDGNPDAELATRVVNHMRENRVLISASGASENVLKIRPPLAFEERHVSRLSESVANALKDN